MKTITFLLACATTATALAHPGPRVWIGNENNQLVTYQQSGTDFIHQQVFLQSLENILDDIWTTDFPGYEVRSNGNVPSGTEIGFDFTGPLLRYTGTGIGFSELSAPTDTKLAITNEIDETLFSSTGVAPGYLFFYPTAPGDHAHLFYTPCGDGVNAGGAPDGVYIQPLRLTSTSLGDSNWYFLVLSQNGSAQNQTDAVSLAHTMSAATQGDTNFDGIVNFTDLLTVAQNYGTGSGSWWTKGDFDFNGAVDFSDLLVTAQNYSNASARGFDVDWNLARSAVPEPNTLGLFALMLILMRRK